MIVLIAGGGTGGHLFPGIAVAEELRRRSPDNRIVFVGTARGIEVGAVPKAGFELRLLPVSGLRRLGLGGLLLGVARLPLAMAKALALVWRLRPDVAVSVGGYAAGPAVLAARLGRVPCVVMEQNAVPGLTNRLLARLCQRVLVGMPVRDLPASKVQVLGNPVRQELQAVREVPYRPHAPLRILVFGGSQGAVALNTAVVGMLGLAQAEGRSFELRHQVGKANVDAVRADYARLERPADGSSPIEVLAFIDDMAAAFAWADLVICRAGAMSVAELTVCGRPAILVPYPYAVDDHQTKNAMTLVDDGAAWLLPQADLNAQSLWQKVSDLMNDGRRLEQMAHASREMGRPQAAAAIADAITELADV